MKSPSSCIKHAVACIIALAILLCMSAHALVPHQVLVVYNAQSAQSKETAEAYAKARPGVQLLAVQWKADGANDDIATPAEFTALDATIRSAAVARNCDVIVLCRNLPYRRYPTGSIDSYIAGDRGVNGGARSNPYLAQSAPFTHARFGCYIVCRLDGWSYADAQGLIAHATAPHVDAPVLFDQDPAQTGGFIRYNTQQALAAKQIDNATLDTTTLFCGGTGLGGYCSWGSNDKHFQAGVYGSLSFVPGSVASTAVSTSARYLRYTASACQSQIATLITAGVSGVTGDVTEPFLAGIARPDYLFPHYYAAGQQWGEAAFSATPNVSWTGVVVGDPLMTWR